jgi:hypothetical protein
MRPGQTEPGMWRVEAAKRGGVGGTPSGARAGRTVAPERRDCCSMASRCPSDCGQAAVEEQTGTDTFKHRYSRRFKYFTNNGENRGHNRWALHVLPLKLGQVNLAAAARS